MLRCSQIFVSLEPIKALFCPKRVEYYAIFPEKIVLNDII
jgi:hypothetical protein